MNDMANIVEGLISAIINFYNLKMLVSLLFMHSYYTYMLE